jgi:hypothetical protein
MERLGEDVTRIGAAIQYLRRHQKSVTLMFLLRRVLCGGPPKPYHAHPPRRSLATQTGLLGELTSRGFISQVTK